MKTDYTYCTVKYRHCNKQRDCKRWLANYSEEEQIKALYSNNISFIIGENCLHSGYELFERLDK